MAVFRVPLRACLLALVPLLISVPGAGDDQNAEEVSAEQVLSLIDQLDSDTLAVRVEAERRLQKLGPPVLSYLPSPATLSASAGETIKRIRRVLEEQQALKALRPSRVTLHGNRPLEEILAAIRAQTGNTFDLSELTPRLLQQVLDVEFKQTPFWQSVRQLEEQAPINISPGKNPSALTVRKRTDDETLPSLFVVEGPFRIDAVSARLRPDFIDPDRQLLRVTLDLFTEPRLRPLFVYMADKNFSVSVASAASTVEPETLPPLSPQASHEIPVDKPGPVRISYDVTLPQQDASTPLQSVTLQGRLEVELAAAEEPFEFRHLDEPGPVTRRHGGVRITLDDVQVTGTDLQASLQIRYESGTPVFESHRAWVFHNAIWLTDPEDDQHIRPAEFETIQEGAGGATLRYRFADVAARLDSLQLTYGAPTLVTRIPFEFSLKNIPVDE